MYQGGYLIRTWPIRGHDASFRGRCQAAHSRDEHACTDCAYYSLVSFSAKRLSEATALRFDETDKAHRKDCKRSGFWYANTFGYANRFA